MRDASSPAEAGASLSGLLTQAGVTTSSAILVTGASGLAALLWLCRRGYDKVGYVRSGAVCGAEDADALVIAQSCNAAELEARLAGAPHLRDGGVVVFQCRKDSAPAADCVLRRQGYSSERRLHGAHRDVVVARRCTAGLARAA